MKTYWGILGLLLSIFLMTFSHSTLANFQKGFKHYQAKEFEEAFRIFEAMAEVGDYGSMFNLGVMYHRGEFAVQNSIEAYAFIKIAADATSDPNYIKAADSIYKGLAEDKKLDAIHLYEEKANLFLPNALNDRMYPRLLADEQCAAAPKRIFTKPPTYPKKALKKRKVGSIVVESNITPEGYPRDVTVASYTDKVFVNKGARSVLKYKYEKPISVYNDGMFYGASSRIAFSIKGLEYNSTFIKKQLKDSKERAENGGAVDKFLHARTLNVFRMFKSLLKDTNLEYQESNKYLTSSAKLGLPHAQYVLGRNMIRGLGCEQDISNGEKWIKAAAASGLAEAQVFLASRQGPLGDRGAKESAKTWLKNASQSDYFPARLLYSWQLSTQAPGNNAKADKAIGRQALKILDVENDLYFDEVRILETKAAAYAKMGDFSEAVDLQEEAIEEATDLDWDIPVMKARLASYQDKQIWQGSYYPEI